MGVFEVYIQLHNFTNCCKIIGESDHIPVFLSDVFDKPEKFLKGPVAKHKIKQEHWLIVGGGISGLMSAYMLLRIGHKVFSSNTMLTAERDYNARIWYR